MKGGIFLDTNNMASTVFGMVKDVCKNQMPESPYNLWIKDLECISIDPNGAVIVAQNDLYKNVLETRYKELLSSAFEQVMGFVVEIKILSVTEQQSKEEAPVKVTPIPEEKAFTFDSFVVGPSNNFAYAACQAVAAGPAPSYNPLFIYGDSGLGKTHLLRAICAEVEKKHPEYNIIYSKGESFANELIEAIRSKNTSSFHDKYRQADLLLIDDIQFIGGKESTQEEFFHTFNELHEAGKQIVLASDRPPKEIKTLEDRLRTRFESGIMADIQAPNYETRVAILKRMADSLRFSIPDQVIDYIATTLKNSVRQLEGTIKKLYAYGRFADLPPTVNLAKTSISEILTDSQPLSVTVDNIIGEVARYFEVDAKDIKSSKRDAKFSIPRQVAMYIIKESLSLPLETVGSYFSDRDHSTVLYSINQVEAAMETKPQFKNTVDDIRKNINSK